MSGLEVRFPLKLGAQKCRLLSYSKYDLRLSMMSPQFFADCCTSPVWLWLSWSAGNIWLGFGHQVYDRTLVFAKDDYASESPLFLRIKSLPLTQWWIPGCYYSSGTLENGLTHFSLLWRSIQVKELKSNIWQGESLRWCKVTYGMVEAIIQLY